MSITMTLRHLGPGPHPSGSPQSTHGDREQSPFRKATSGGDKAVAKEEPLGRGGTADGQKLTLVGDGDAVWKAWELSTPAGLQKGAMEVIAYRLWKLLGITEFYVPETVPMKHEGKDGSVQQWVDKVLDGYSSVRRRATPEESAAMGLFDLLLGNWDRHDGNWLIDEGGNGRVVAIDHGLSDPGYKDIRPRLRQNDKGEWCVSPDGRLEGDHPTLLPIPRNMVKAAKSLTKEEFDAVMEDIPRADALKRELWTSIRQLANRVPIQEEGV